MSSPLGSSHSGRADATLRRGLSDLLAGRIERFVHTCQADSRLWGVSRFGAGEATHFAATPEALAGDTALFAALGRALGEAARGRQPIERRFTIETPGARARGIRVAPIRVGRRVCLLAYPDDLPSLSEALPPHADRLLQAQEEERHRIAIELHDSTSQHLVAVSLGLARLRRFIRAGRAERRVVEEMSRTLQAAIKEIRTFSYLMNPPQLERDGLEATVRRFAAGFESRTGVATSLGIRGGPDVASAGVQHTLFRVLQEALTGVYRKANATHVDIALEKRGGWVRLTIADDGPDRVEGDDQLPLVPVGVGIAGMRAPVEQLGGSLRVIHGPEGSRVTARLPTGNEPRRAPRRRSLPSEANLDLRASVAGAAVVGVSPDACET